jgi:23S rRNA (pseudouridine1915-N3)-methyltransferase
MLKIIAIGKKTDHDQAIDQYLKRLRKPYDCKITLLNFSHEKDLAARKNESEAILNRIEDDDFVILLDENGKELNNHQLNDKIKQNYGKLVFIIGGPYGVDQRLIKRANFI